MPDLSGLTLPTAEDIVIAAARAIQEHLGEDPLAEALRDVLTEFGAAVFSHDPPRMPLPALLPAMVHAGVTASGAAAAPLCGAVLLLFIGIDLLDDIMDGDVTPYWRGTTPAETLLVATTLTAALPQAIVGALDAPPETVSAMQRTLAAGLLGMAAGQRADLLATGRFDLSPEQVLQSVAGKSGAFTGMIARLGAQLAGAPDDVVDAYGDWGFAFGIADQLATDCGDLYLEPVGNDLKRGIFTYPLACLVESRSEPERARTVATIRAAADSFFDQYAVRGALQDTGVLAIVDHTIRWHHQQALAALQRAGPQTAAGDALRALVESSPNRVSEVAPACETEGL